MRLIGSITLLDGSIPLRRAFCASLVIASASSKMTNLNPERKMVRVLAKLRICPRTIPMPLSSDALSCGEGRGERVMKGVRMPAYFAYFSLKNLYSYADF